MRKNATPTLTLRLFGGFEARSANGARLQFRTVKSRALVAYLALEADTHHPRNKLATLLWGETTDAHARDSLRQALSAVRRALGVLSESPLVISQDGLAFNRALIDVDVFRFNQLITTCSIDALRTAVELHRGRLFDGIVLMEESFESWLIQQRDALNARLTGALEWNLAAQLDAGRSQDAAEVAKLILQVDRAHEVAHRALMSLNHEQGKRAAALRQYGLCAESLKAELGTMPDRQTRALHDAILRGERNEACGANNHARYRGASCGARARRQPVDVPLVGRSVELGVLRSAVDAASRGSGGCMFVIGEAGIGKTRVVQEAMLGTGGNTRVLQAQAYENESAHALGPWVDAMRSVHIDELQATVAGLDDEWQRELTGLVPQIRGAMRAPRARANERCLFDAVLHLLSRLGESGLTVVTLEDLHWADSASLRLLSFIARRIESSRVLLIATMREEEMDRRELRDTAEGLVSASLAQVVELKPLSEPHTRELLEQMYGPETVPDLTGPTGVQIWQWSKGIPLVVVEIVRAIREGTKLGILTAGNVPDSIRRVVGCRVRALSEGTHGVLAIAAVIGCDFEFSLIAKVTDLPPSELVSALEEAIRRKMLQSTNDRLSFTHAWIGDCIYESLLPPRREWLHLRVALAYEAMTFAGSQCMPAKLAYHYARAKAWAETAANATRAGDLALCRYAYSEAATLFGSARQALEQLSPDAQVTRELVAVLVKLHRALVPTGLATPIVTNLRDAESLSEHAGDSSLSASVLLCASEYARWTGDYATAIDSGERGLSTAVYAGHTALAAEARFHLGLARFWKGDYRSAIACLRQSAIDAGVGGDLHNGGEVLYASIGSREYLALALASTGRFASARKIAEAAIGTAANGQNPLPQIAAARALGFVLVEQGEFDAAVPLLTRTLASCEHHQLDLLYSLIAGTLGYAYAVSGRARQGAVLIEKAIAQREALRGAYHGSYGAYLLSRMAEASLLAGQIDAAMKYAQRVDDFAQRYDNRVDEAWSLRLCGDLAANNAESHVEAVEALYLRSRAIAERQGMFPFVAHCDFRIARLAGRGLDRDRARAARHRARATYARLGMSYWLARTGQSKWHARDSV